MVKLRSGVNNMPLLKINKRRLALLSGPIIVTFLMEMILLGFSAVFTALGSEVAKVVRWLLSIAVKTITQEEYDNARRESEKT